MIERVLVKLATRSEEDVKGRIRVQGWASAHFKKKIHAGLPREQADRHGLRVEIEREASRVRLFVDLKNKHGRVFSSIGQS